MDRVDRRLSGPPPLQKIGDILAYFRALQRDVLGVMGQRFATYNDFYTSAFRSFPAYMTCDPDVIRKVLVDDARAFVKRTLDLEVLGNGLLTSDGETWRRRLVTLPAEHEGLDVDIECLSLDLARTKAERPQIHDRHGMSVTPSECVAGDISPPIRVVPYDHGI